MYVGRDDSIVCIFHANTFGIIKNSLAHSLRRHGRHLCLGARDGPLNWDGIHNHSVEEERKEEWENRIAGRWPCATAWRSAATTFCLGLHATAATAALPPSGTYQHLPTPPLLSLPGVARACPFHSAYLLCARRSSLTCELYVVTYLTNRQDGEEGGRMWRKIS